ncbi:hypothetical protein IFM89_012038 [Coptis chinensis]|uniref:Endonuclease/exonuclease/phosphatase domain-containing protein n=1 Tax=Coptis chinensis TaxID=261450 RepID=A0A835IV07_9MAGN|nr:hypothetical protein IFM89_012038 [Coptis chinensis]
MVSVRFSITITPLTGSYGICRQLWQELSLLGTNGQAWAVIGDFNIVTSIAKRKGGTPCISAMDDFNNFIHSNALIDSTNSGFKYSWCNKRWGSKRMLQKIDRMLHLKRLEEEMDRILLDQEHDPTDPTLQQMEFDKASEIEEVTNVLTTMAKEKSRVSEALHGERNSAYFHATIKM